MNPTLRSAWVFPAWVAGTVALALARPHWFTAVGEVDLKVLIVPLIQIIMFGMGATLGVSDFVRVARMPVPILVGVVAQFVVMPLLGWALATLGGFEPEVGAGIILVGCVAGGVASNVATFLAGGNVPLSVTMTLCSTLASPVLTPLLMKWLAGRLVPIAMGPMMISILNMIVLPVVVGLLAHQFFEPKCKWNRRPGVLLGSAAGFVCASGGVWQAWASARGSLAEVRVGLVLGLAFLAFVAVARWWMDVRLGRQDDWLGRMLSVLSMAGICCVIAIITGRSRDALLGAAPLLLVVAVIHNGVGYALGYWSARAARLTERDCRTVAIEVGMQNAGMATGIAMNVLQSSGAALASVVFGPWMNISAALLAGWWRRHPAPAEAQAVKPHAATHP